jgi:hypothetical protein
LDLLQELVVVVVVVVVIVRVYLLLLPAARVFLQENHAS